MRSSTLILIMCLSSFVATAQTSSPQAPAAPSPQTSATPGEKPSEAGSSTKPPSAKLPAAEAKEVPPDAPVITIKGLCSTTVPKPASSKTVAAAKAAKPAPCQTIVTRKQLELVIETVRPNLQPAQRRMLAQQYAELLVMANAATKAGVEKEPKVQEQLRLSKLQVLATAYSREIQQKESEVPPADIEKYYKEHASQYEQAKLLRIYVPMVTAEEGKPPDVAATKIVAEKIQQRAAAGEDFEKLQQEAFANSKGTAPSTYLGERRRGTLPPKQEEAVFALKAGEVSPVLEEASGFYIYKTVSKEGVPLDKVRDEIKSTLAREHAREALEKLRTSLTPTFNDAYFGSAAQPPTGGELHRHPGGAGSGPTPPAAPSHSATPAQPATPAGAAEAPKPPPPAPPTSK